MCFVYGPSCLPNVVSIILFCVFGFDGRFHCLVEPGEGVLSLAVGESFCFE